MPTVDSAAQTQSVIIRVKTTHPIPENLVAKVRILKTLRTGAVSVPASAILTDETQTDFWIMKLTDSVTAVKVPITKGLATKDRVEILTPVLTDSDRILITGNYGLEDTAKVKIIEPGH
jgi:multidrug efflux pump subunit AcrA (membrane-fusion protein)